MAHAWYNLAAVTGNIEAFRLRREITEKMSIDEVRTAQRTAQEIAKAKR